MIETLVDTYPGSGNHKAVWDASDYSSGIYFYKLTAGDKTSTNPDNSQKPINGSRRLVLRVVNGGCPTKECVLEISKENRRDKHAIGALRNPPLPPRKIYE